MRCTVKYRVCTPSIPGPDLPLIRDKRVAEHVARTTTRAGHPTTIEEVLVR